MIVYRIAPEKYAGDLSGRGAELFGGRWNSAGVPLLYTSESISLALAETLVNTPNAKYLPAGYQLLTLELPNSISLETPGDLLPTGWNAVPYPSFLAEYGNAFARRGTSLALKVPSAVVPKEFNILLNPRHLEFSLVRILSLEQYEFDARLIRLIQGKH